MKRLWNYIKKYIGIYVIALSTMSVATALDMFNPRISKIIVDDVIVGHKLYLFKGAILALAGITLSRAILGYIKEISFDFTASRIIASLRKDLFDHIQSLSFHFFDNMNTGELMSRVKEDTDNIWNAFGFGIMVTTEQVLYFITATVLIFLLDWKLAFISLVTMPLIAFIALKLERKAGEIYGKISDQGVKMNTTAQEDIAGIRLVKAFGREKFEIQRFLLQNRENYDLNIEQSRTIGRYYPLIEFLSNIAVTFVIVFGGLLVIGDSITIGTLVAFSNYIYMLIGPVRSIGWLMNVLAQAGASLKKIEKIFSRQPEIKNPEHPIAVSKIYGGLEFKDVCFEHNGTQVLKNINFKIEPGKTVAIMGATGAGKSTIINLIGRFYDCTSGNITVDGKDIKKLDLNQLRSNISVVMQDTFLFSDTIDENIKFGLGDVPDEALLKAADDAMVDEFVDEMPDGYKTIIGERGIGLSGGQKQRISIARALIRNSPVLILDDATSALDMETEYRIQKAIERHRDITKIIIAHRVSAVKNADEILVMKDGRIVERGNHDMLISLKGRYYDIYCQQLGEIDNAAELEVV